MGAQPGLRERKKQRTRQLIADTAWRLFADRGFDRVTVAEVAREAQVAEATVFNYFPTKEDLFYHRLEAFEAGLVEAVAAREAGEPALAAVRRYLLASDGLLTEAAAGDADALQRLRTVNRVIAASPALQAREQLARAPRPFPQMRLNPAVRDLFLDRAGFAYLEVSGGGVVVSVGGCIGRAGGASAMGGSLWPST
jgi:AcrR family transcriptional regulator